MDELSLEARLLLLTIIEKNGSIDELFEIGYKYFQISIFLKSEIELGNAEYVQDILVITEKGLSEKKALAESLNFKKAEVFLTKKMSESETKIDIDEIFIPSPDELFF